MKTLVTGANGFVGTAVLSRLAAAGTPTVAATRQPTPTSIAIGNIDATTDWQPALINCDAVIHLAARVHVMQESSADPLTEFRHVNVEGTANLARQAAAAGVKRFIYMSSLKVLGEEGENPYRESDIPQPQDAYGISKWEAEQALMKLADEAGMEWVILRPPLVYGPGVGANFLRLARLVASGMPLPFASVQNRRSLVYVDNLADLVLRCLEAPQAAREVFLVDDGAPMSLPELLRAMAAGLNRPARLFPLPLALLATLTRVTGKQALWQRLGGSLYVDSSKARQLLDWTPPFAAEQALASTMRACFPESSASRQ